MSDSNAKPTRYTILIDLDNITDHAKDDAPSFKEDTSVMPFIVKANDYLEDVTSDDDKRSYFETLSRSEQFKYRCAFAAMTREEKKIFTPEIKNLYDYASRRNKENPVNDFGKVKEQSPDAKEKIKQAHIKYSLLQKERVRAKNRRYGGCDLRGHEIIWCYLLELLEKFLDKKRYGDNVSVQIFFFEAQVVQNRSGKKKKVEGRNCVPYLLQRSSQPDTLYSTHVAVPTLSEEADNWMEGYVTQVVSLTHMINQHCDIRAGGDTYVVTPEITVQPEGWSFGEPKTVTVPKHQARQQWGLVLPTVYKEVFSSEDKFEGFPESSVKKNEQAIPYYDWNINNKTATQSIFKHCNAFKRGTSVANTDKLIILSKDGDFDHFVKQLKRDYPEETDNRLYWLHLKQLCVKAEGDDDQQLKQPRLKNFKWDRLFEEIGFQFKEDFFERRQSSTIES
tara:strand:+ start:126 stop:1472 length:1347 start_codon:yes stop_codon:yes gene_type:complete